MTFSLPIPTYKAARPKPRSDTPVRVVPAPAVKVGDQAMDMAFRGDELLVACQGDGTVHVIDVPTRRHKQSFNAGTGCESLGFF